MKSRRAHESPNIKQTVPSKDSLHFAAGFVNYWAIKRQVIIMVNGLKIRTLREAQNLTTYEFAEKIQISQTMLIHVENNVKAPSIALLKRIADYFGCKMDDLLKPETA